MRVTNIGNLVRSCIPSCNCYTWCVNFVNSVQSLSADWNFVLCTLTVQRSDSTSLFNWVVSPNRTDHKACLMLCGTNKVLSKVFESISTQWRGSRGEGGGQPPSDNFSGAVKSKEGAKICNCQCEISYKIIKV